MSQETKSTNYLSPELFYGPFLKHLVLLDEFHSQTRPPAMPANNFYWAARLQYGIGGRISEILGLKKSDFDLNNRILTIRESKTGWKHCKCSKWELDQKTNKKSMISADNDCKLCNGDGWARVIQKTTILPYDVEGLEKFLQPYSKDERMFTVTRSTMWRYYKNAGILGNINLFNAKETVNIEGAYTHLMRESCSKMYEKAGARFGIVARKLRHTPGRNVTLRYTMADLNEVLDFDWDHFKKLN